MDVNRWSGWNVVMQVNRDRLLAEIKTAGYSQRRLAREVSAKLEGRTFSKAAVSHLVADPPRQETVVEPVAEAIAAVLECELAHLFKPKAKSLKGMA